MTARDEMAALLDGEFLITSEHYLDAIASLATSPETAPVVFRWLLEAGVLNECETSTRMPTQADTLAWVRRQWPDKLTPLDRAAKLCEEAGETIGAVIKISEGRKTPADLARETAQVTICAMALAEAAGFDLWTEVADEYARATDRYPA